MNYFQLFNIPQSYIFDSKYLQQRYLVLQATYHPDRAKDDLERRKNLEQSMLINEGFKVLKDDYLRAIHLLELNGQIFDETSLKNTLPPGELEEILDQYELIENNNDITLLRYLEKKKLLEQAGLLQEIGVSFAKNDIEQTMYLVASLKYLSNLLGNIRLKIRNL